MHAAGVVLPPARVTVPDFALLEDREAAAPIEAAELRILERAIVSFKSRRRHSPLDADGLHATPRIRSGPHVERR